MEKEEEMQHVRVATYTITSGTAQEIFRAGEEGMLPVFKGQPGFLGYGLAHDGSGTVLSITRWKTHEAAENATVAAAEWVKENLSDRLSLLSNYVGDFGFYAES